MKMEPKDKEVIDLDFDPDILAKYLEKLNLETDIPDFSESLNGDEINALALNFEEDCSVKQFSDKESNKIVPCLNQYTKNNEIGYREIKNEEVSVNCLSDQLSSEDKKSITVSIKKEIDSDGANISGNDINIEEKALCSKELRDKEISPILIKKEISKIQNEILSDSDTDQDEENLDLLLCRGPDRNKKRYHKRKQSDKQSRLNRSTDTSNLDQQRLLFLSSGHIVSNNNGNNSPQLLTQNAITNFDCVTTNYCLVGSPGESGYETSQSSSLYSPVSNGPYSPSSSSVDNSQASNTFETSDEEAFVDFILELGETLESSSIGKTDCNIPVWDDDDCDYIEKLKNYLKETDDDPIQFHQSTSQIGEILEHSSSETSPAAVSPKIASKTSNKLVLKKKSRKLSFKLNNDAKYLLRYSKSFNEDKYFNEQRLLFKEIQEKQRSRSEFKIIEYEKVEENGNKNFRRTNLHTAVLNSNIEKVYCLIEAVKIYRHPLFDVNIRDDDNKTALDYAVREKMPLIIDYLEENTAVLGIKCKQLI